MSTLLAHSGHSKEVRLLNVGNSFTWSLHPYLGKMVEHEGKHKLVHKQCSVGGCELSRHWRYVEEFEKEGKRVYSWDRDEAGNEVFISLKEALASAPWDVVTVQQASHESWRPECYLPWGEKLVNYIRENAPQATVMLQRTWSYRSDAPRLAEWGITQEEMYHRLWLAYQEFARKMNLPVIPAGDAIQLARTLQKGVFQHYDWKAAESLEYPQTPDQSWSFINGFFWYKDAEGKQVSVNDTIHLNARGRYVQALIWYGVLFDEDPVAVTYTPEELEAEDAAFLREVAGKVLQKGFYRP
ncbi:MAG: DUF4886 domain-containing protein [Oligosphaeraceae bacterium]